MAFELPSTATSGWEEWGITCSDPSPRKKGGANKHEQTASYKPIGSSKDLQYILWALKLKKRLAVLCFLLIFEDPPLLMSTQSSHRPCPGVMLDKLCGSQALTSWPRRSTSSAMARSIKLSQRSMVAKAQEKLDNSWGKGRVGNSWEQKKLGDQRLEIQEFKWKQHVWNQEAPRPPGGIKKNNISIYFTIFHLYPPMIYSIFFFWHHFTWTKTLLPRPVEWSPESSWTLRGRQPTPCCPEAGLTAEG